MAPSTITPRCRCLCSFRGNRISVLLSEYVAAFVRQSHLAAVAQTCLATQITDSIDKAAATSRDGFRSLTLSCLEVAHLNSARSTKFPMAS